MFTGWIREMGQIATLEWRGDVLHYAVAFPEHYLSELERGTSVSVEGVCQTVVAIEGNLVWFDAIEETLSRTTIGNLKPQTPVHLERSAKIGDEVAGHPLSGHIYATAELHAIEKNIFTFKAAHSLMRYLFSKGYIALDGVSLTLVEVDLEAALFSVHLIPETLAVTHFGSKKVGDSVNVEVDALTQAAVETVERVLKRTK